MSNNTQVGKQKFSIPKEAYYLIRLPDGSEHTLLLEIGKEYSVEELQKLASMTQVGKEEK